MRGNGPLDRVQVVVRVRPTFQQDGADSPAVVVDPNHKRMQVVMPTTEVDKGMRRPRAQARAYEFDSCLSSHTSQAELYEACGISRLVDDALAGYSVTVFAFGQTGAGKTFSLSGPSGKGMMDASDDLHVDDGLIARALHYMYAKIESDYEVKHEIRASFFEIYNEQVRDLTVDNQTPLNVRHNKRVGFFVDGLLSKPVPRLHDAQQQVMNALTNRMVGAHKMNRNSNRSHCMLTFHLESTPDASGSNLDYNHGMAGLRRFGKLCFVDLAGSERLKETQATAASTVRETGNINRSLFALGKVISALSEAKRSTARQRPGSRGADFVPFRDSKLTQLLIDSLRGTGRALMLACCSPALPHAEETMNTLHFASMALHVRSQPVLLLDPADQLVLDLKTTIKELRSENKKLMAMLDSVRGGGPDSPVTGQYGRSGWASASEAEDDTDPLSIPYPSRLPKTPAGAIHQPKPKKKAAPVYGTPLQDENYSGYSSAGGYTRGRGGAWASPPNSPKPARKPLSKRALLDGANQRRLGTHQAMQSPPTHSAPPAVCAAAVQAGSNFATGLRVGSGGGSSGGWISDSDVSAESGKCSGDTAHGRQAWGASRPQPPPPPQAPAPPADLDNFPELAALEAQFAATMASAAPAGALARPLVAGSQLSERTTMSTSGAGDTWGTAGADLYVSAQSTEEYPSLAALEAQFQERLREARLAKAAGGVSHVPKPKLVTKKKLLMEASKEPSPAAMAAEVAWAASQYGRAPAAGPSTGAGEEAQAASVLAAEVAPAPELTAEAAEAAEAALAPESKAAAWAVRNKWFGTDVELTEAAYDIHDELMSEGVDPISDFYYEAIESRVHKKFPERFRPKKATFMSQRSYERCKRHGRAAGGVGGGSSSGKKQTQEQKLQAEMRQLTRTQPVSTTSSVRKILKSINTTDYAPLVPKSPAELGLSADAYASLSVAGQSYSVAERRRIPASASPHKGSTGRSSGRRPAWMGGSADSYRCSGDERESPVASPFIVNTSDFLTRRQAVLEELKLAKQEAIQEHRKLQAKIRKRLEARGLA